MALKVQLAIPIEYEGATFTVAAADGALAQYVRALFGLPEEMREALVAAAQGGDVTLEVPPALWEPLCDVFVEAVRDWRGVQDAAGNDIECTAQARRDFPTGHKIQVGLMAIGAFADAQEKKDGQVNSHTNSTPPATTPDA